MFFMFWHRYVILQNGYFLCFFYVLAQICYSPNWVLFMFFYLCFGTDMLFSKMDTFYVFLCFGTDMLFSKMDTFYVFFMFWHRYVILQIGYFLWLCSVLHSIPKYTHPDSQKKKG